MWGILATFVGNRSYRFNSMSIYTRNPVHCRTVIILHARYVCRWPNSPLLASNKKHNLELLQQNHQHNDDSDDHDNNNNNDNDNSNNKWQTMMAMKKWQ